MQRAGIVEVSDRETIAYSVDCYAKPWAETPTLLMLHSLMGHSGRFVEMIPQLAAYFRVVRMDLRGHGGSSVPAPDSELSLERMTRDVVEVLDALELASVHVVGNSAGGYLSQMLAIDAPERVDSLCLFGSTPGLKGSGARDWLPLIARMGLREFLADTIADRFPVEREDPRKIEWFLDECAKNDTDFIVRCMEHFTALDWSDRLGGITCPTLIVAAGAETVGSADRYADMAARIDDARLVYYRGLPHNICDIVPHRCSSDILTFLRWTFSEFDDLP